MGSTVDEITRVIECIRVNLLAVESKLAEVSSTANLNQHKVSVWGKEARHLRRALEKKEKELKEKGKRVMA